VPEVAACGRSEGSDGHTPLPKRGPHLRKRTPPAAAGAAAAQAPRVRVHSGRTWWHRRQGPQQHTVAPSREEPTEITRRTDRTEPIEHRPRPTPPSASRPYFRFLARPTPASLRVASMVDPPVSQHIPIHASHPPRPRCRRPAPGPPAPAWANPPHIYLARRGRGDSALRWSPFLESPGGKRKTTVGGAAARSRLRRTPRNEHQETNTKRRTGSRRPRYRVHAKGEVQHGV
jgi:hypothetical protein